MSTSLDRRMPSGIALALAFAGVLALGLPTAGAQLRVPALLAPASYLGVGIMEVSPGKAKEIGLIDPHGVEISSVAQDSPALRAGLEAGDIVLTYRDERVNGMEHFARLVRETPVGGNVELGVVRAQERLAVEVRVGRRETQASVQETIEAVRDRLALDERQMDSLRQHMDSVRQHLESVRGRFRGDERRPCPDCPVAESPPGSHFGSSLRRLSDSRTGLEIVLVSGQLAEFFGVERGALVRSVLDGSPAVEAGLRAGDVIVGADGRQLSSFEDFRAAVLSLGAGGSADLAVVRERESVRVQLEVPRGPHRIPGRRIAAPE